MTAVRKFLFETSFDAPAQPEEPAIEEAGEQPDAPAPPQHSEEELAQARREAYQSGLEAGREQTEAELVQQQEASLEASLSELNRQLAALMPRIDASFERARNDAIRAGVQVVQKLFPHLVEQQGDREIRALLEDSLMRLMEEPRIVIRVHDSQLDTLRAQMETIKEGTGYEGKTVLLADQDIRPGDIRMEWADGGVERDSERAWQEIGTLIERSLAPQAETAPAAKEASTSDPAASGIETDEQGVAAEESGGDSAQPNGEILAPAHDSQAEDHPQDAESAFAEERN